MPDIHILFGILSILFIALGNVIYFKSIYKGKTKPHMFSFIVWGIVMAIILVAQVTSGAGAGAWANAIATIMVFIIAYIGWRQKEITITKSDTFSFIFALSIIPLWLLTDSALLAVVLATTIDLIGYYPTIRKTYAMPYSENITSYGVFAAAMLASIFAMSEVSITNILYPIAIVLANTLFIVTTIVRRRKIKPLKV